MGIKTAKSSFTKDDVIEILKQNVTLYKDEPEFVEYIVNLALYLIDQTCMKAGERPGTIDEILQGYEEHRRKTAEKARAEANQRPRKAELESEDEEIEEKRPTNKIRLSTYDAVIKHPPTPGPGISDTEREDLDELDVSEAAAEQSPFPVDEAEFDLELPRTRQLPSVGIMTPQPEGGLDKGPRIQVDQSGRTRIYKVVRSYNERKVVDGTCPICGTRIGTASRCNSCGHIL